MNWKQYQEQTADFFRSLGCDAELEATISGARGKHRIDVWVRFEKFGLETKWVVECKNWNSAVTKEKVLVLKSVVDDVGADRGILISTAGFQSGAVRASDNTNITLTDLDELKETAQDDLIASVLHRIETKAVEIKYALHDLYTSEQTGAHSWISRPRPGIDTKVVINTIGKLAILDFGLDQIRLKKPPYMVTVDATGQRTLAVDTLDEFVAQASEVIREAEATLNSQLNQQPKDAQ